MKFNPDGNTGKSSILLIYTHRKNIERLKAGTESKIYVWRPHDSTAAKGPAESGDTNAAGHDTDKTAGDR